jgi:hypothetical protein
MTYQASALIRQPQILLPRCKGPLTDHARNPTQNRKTDVDQEVGIASSLEKDGERGEEDRQEVKANVGLRKRSLVNCPGTGMESSPPSRREN